MLQVCSVVTGRAGKGLLDDSRSKEICQHMMLKDQLNVLFTSGFRRGITYDHMVNSITITKPQTNLDNGLKCVLFKSKSGLDD